MRIKKFSFMIEVEFWASWPLTDVEIPNNGNNALRELTVLAPVKLRRGVALSRPRQSNEKVSGHTCPLTFLYLY